MVGFVLFGLCSLPAALHGVEASLLASGSLLKLRSAVCRVVWSRRQPLANVGAVLSMLDGPSGCDLCFESFGFGFVFFVGFLLCGLLELIVLIVFWIWSVRVVVVMCPFISLFLVLLRLVSGGSSFPCLASAWFAFTQQFGWSCAAFSCCYS